MSMMKNSSDQMEGVLTKKDLMNVFWRSFTMEWAWNYERQMNLGYCYSMIPVLDKLYDKKEDRVEAYKRHLEFYNVTPWLSSFPLGISIAMEEKNAVNKNLDTSSINNIKVALMGPLSGIGDSFFWGTLRIIAMGIGTSLALEGNILGPLLFLFIFNIPAILARYFGLFAGYKLGAGFLDKIKESGLMDKLTFGASIIGLMVVGAMIASMVSITMPLKIGSGKDSMTLDDMFNNIIPGLLPLLFTGFIYYLVKKGVKAHWVLLLMVLIGIVGAYTGILGV